MSLSEFLTGKSSVEEFRSNYGDKYTNWCLPENRIESFTRVYDTRMRCGELDHWLAGKVIADYMKLTEEQKAWYALLFGFSYRNHWAMIVLQLFPEIWKTDPEKIREWYNDSPKNNNFGAWRRANFAKDTKWNVRKFPDFIESVQKWLDGESLLTKLSEISSVGDKNKNFDNLNTSLITNMHGIGRMTSWLTIQTLYEFFNFDVDKWDLQLKDEGCWSQYDALCYLFNRLDLAGAEKYWDGKKWSIRENKKTPESLKIMNENTEKLMDYMTNRLDYHVDIYNVESCLCEYRKTGYGPRKLKEFTFWTYNEMIYQFEDLVNLWETHKPNIDWTGYVLAYATKGDVVTKYGYDKSYFRVLHDTGLNLNTHHFYADEPNAFDLLDIPKPEECPRVKLYDDMVNSLDQEVFKTYKEKYDPLKHLRQKK